EALPGHGGRGAYSILVETEPSFARTRLLVWTKPSFARTRRPVQALFATARGSALDCANVRDRVRPWKRRRERRPMARGEAARDGGADRDPRRSELVHGQRGGGAQGGGHAARALHDRRARVAREV